ncbi:MAG: hypothetical protein MUC85_02245 [Anaerolineales bacterium]|nr:hypothetical protein [Anaerolineales bacterium]
MAQGPFSLREDYWETFEVEGEDIEFLYNYLLDKEIPLTSKELIAALAEERIRQEKISAEKKRKAVGTTYFPKDTYQAGQTLIFPALNWRMGQVKQVRPGYNPDLGEFQVIQVAFDPNDQREFASGIAEHILNNPPDLKEDQPDLDLASVLDTYSDTLLDSLEQTLEDNDDFVRIAGKWFPRALLLDINVGHLNLAEAVLDMAGGGPASTVELLQQIGLADAPNPKLTEFSLDLALQEDSRFDEVGPSGEVLWYLNRLEPEGVLKPHLCLRYHEVEYDRALITDKMLALERELDDELSPFSGKIPHAAEVQLALNFPHWRAGTLPLSARVRHLFPTAYEAPRVRIILVDGETGQKFPGWVVRTHRYVYGLREWYQEKGIIPGSLIRVRRGAQPGEVIVQVESRKPTRDWVRTVLVGSDGGMVFVMLKQPISTTYDERMTIAVPDPEALEQVWQNTQKDRVPFEKTVVNMVRELAKLNPQSHVHASELYAAVNTVRRCPPGPLMALLVSRPWFIHVGDMHFRFDDSERE